MSQVAKTSVDEYIMMQRLTMCQLSLNIPEEVLYDMRLSKESALALVKQTVAIEFYKTHRISVGYCAEIAGMSEEDFIKLLGSRHISIFHFENENEFMEEMNNA